MIKRSVSVVFFLNLQGELDFAPRFCQTDMSHNKIYILYIIHPQINIRAQFNLVYTDQAQTDNEK